MKKILLKIMVSFAQIIAAIIVIFIIYGLWAWWENRQLKALCTEVHTGTLVSALPELAEKYGFSRRWVEHGIKAENGQDQITFIPASSTMGEVVCAIRYHDDVVISAKMGH